MPSLRAHLDPFARNSKFNHSTTLLKWALSVFSVSSSLSSHNKFAFDNISYSISECSQKILGRFDR